MRRSDECLQDACDEIRPNIQALSSVSPVATIGFPAYNEEDYLLPGLRSLAALETNVPLEFIAANNASNDRTGEILQACGINVVYEPKKGTSYARQALVDTAEGDFLIQTDADTQVPSCWVDKHLEYYKNTEIVGVSGDYSSNGFHPLWQAYRSTSKEVHKLLSRLKIKDFLFGAGANFSARTEILREVGYPPGFNLGEERLIVQLLKKRGIVCYDPSNEIKVQVHGRRFDSVAKISKHFRARIKDRDFLRHIFSNKIIRRDFEDFR